MPRFEPRQPQRPSTWAAFLALATCLGGAVVTHPATAIGAESSRSGQTAWPVQAGPDDPGPMQNVTELSVGAAADGPPQPDNVFRVPLTGFWVRFAYENTSFTTIDISLVSPEGLLAYARSGEFTGVGSEAWEVTGDAIARGMANGAAEAAVNARDNARRAATQDRGVAEYLASAAYATGQMRSGLAMLAAVGLPPDLAAHRAAAAAAVADLARLLAEASRLPPENVAGRQELAGRMAAPASIAVNSTVALRTGIAELSGLTIPATRSAGGENDAYTVAARINGRPARSEPVWVHDGRIFLPASSVGRQDREARAVYSSAVASSFVLPGTVRAGIGNHHGAAWSGVGDPDGAARSGIGIPDGAQQSGAATLRSRSLGRSLAGCYHGRLGQRPHEAAVRFTAPSFDLQGTFTAPADSGRRAYVPPVGRWAGDNVLALNPVSTIEPSSWQVRSPIQGAGA